MFNFFKKKEISNSEEYKKEKEIASKNQPVDEEYFSRVVKEETVTNSGPFRMVIDDIFALTGMGTVVTGKVELGSVSVGDVVKLVSAKTGVSREVTVKGIEMFRKRMQTASAGENVGIWLKDVQKSDISKGDYLEK